MNSEDFSRKSTTVLGEDVTGYSRLMGDNGPDTGRTLIIYREAITKFIQDYHG